MNTEKGFLYKELTGNIIKSAYDVHNKLGCGLLEKVYENGLAWDLQLKEIKVDLQKEYRVIYRDKEVGVYYADMVVEDKVIVEVKSVQEIINVHRAQLLNYLHLSGLRIGFIINFSRPKMEYERLIV